MMGRPVGDNAWLMGEKGGGPSIPAWLASKYFHQRPRRQDDNVKADSDIFNTLSRNIGKYPLHQSGELPNSYFLRELGFCPNRLDPLLPGMFWIPQTKYCLFCLFSYSERFIFLKILDDPLISSHLWNDSTYDFRES